MDSALTPPAKAEVTLQDEFGPISRWLGRRYFDGVRFAPEAVAELRDLHARGYVVHVMRSTAWINYLYLAWALVRRGLPPLRAVVNLRPWFTRPFTKTAQRGDFDVRFTYARRGAGSGLIFLKKSALLSPEGRDITENPFPALVAMARRADRTVFLVPELFVWEKRTARVKPSLMDVLFGSPDAPGFVHAMVAFFRNYKRAQFRVGEPIDLQRFIAENPKDSDEVLARKVKTALHHHLARETRAVFGPPVKPPSRVIEETLRDRSLRRVLEEEAARTGKPPQALLKEARKNLREIAAKQSPTVLSVAAPTLDWVFNRIYDGVEVDEAGLHRAMRAATRAPLVLCPSHKSHVDYLILAWALFVRGYGVPLVAAGANLSFFPLGWFMRRGAAFFLRRSFRGDKVYAASFKAYVKKLIHDGTHQEFFPEGGRSRTGKLLPPKMGMFTWQVDAILEGARDDLLFVPVSIDYEKIVEGGSYSKELAGGEKKPEDLKALLNTPKVLTRRYGRIHLTFDAPVSLRELMESRGLSPREELDDEQKKGLVRALANRVMYGISRVSTVTPHALASAALLSTRGGSLTGRQMAERIDLLRRIAFTEGVPLSTTLRNSPSNPETLGAIHDAVQTFCSDELVRTAHAGDGGRRYSPVTERRPELAFYKNTLLNLVASRSLVASALLAGAPAPYEEVQARALFLSRLFKVEFIYRVGATFEAIFADTVEKLERTGHVLHVDGVLSVPPEPHAQPELEFLADLVRDYLESYLLAVQTLRLVADGKAVDRKAYVKAALDAGRAEYQAGRLTVPEALGKVTLENAVEYLVDQRLLVEEAKQLKAGPAAADAEAREARAAEIRRFLRE